jgi:hypothetical protein
MPSSKKPRKKPKFVFPREYHAHAGGKPLSWKQKRLLHNSQALRSRLFRRNESGNPVEGTYLKSMARLKQIMASDLPRKIKLIERDKWGEVMAMHLIFRSKQWQAREAKFKRLYPRQKPLPERVSRIKITGEETNRETVNAQKLFEEVQLSLKEQFPL